MKVEDWNFRPVTKANQDRAWRQLGTRNSGHHFVEFGLLAVLEAVGDLPAREHLALLNYSGSRGTDAAACDHYSRIARKRRPEKGRRTDHAAATSKPRR